MEQKAKLIIVGLIGVTVVCLFLFIQASGVKQQLTRERDDLKEENTSLTAKVDKLTSNLRGYEEKVRSLNNDLERVSQEKAELDKKYELINSIELIMVESESAVNIFIFNDLNSFFIKQRISSAPVSDMNMIRSIAVRSYGRCGNEWIIALW